MTINQTRKSLPGLSREALASLKLPLKTEDDCVVCADGQILLTIKLLQPRLYLLQRAEIAAFIAALVNAALLPAAAPDNEPDHGQLQGTAVSGRPGGGA